MTALAERPFRYIFNDRGIRRSEYLTIAMFSLSCASIGFALALATYRRWLNADLT